MENAGNFTKVLFFHVNSGRIHRDIRSFVTGSFVVRFAVPQQDLALEHIIGLIRKYCTPLEYH